MGSINPFLKFSEKTCWYEVLALIVLMVVIPVIVIVSAQLGFINSDLVLIALTAVFGIATCLVSLWSLYG